MVDCGASSSLFLILLGCLYDLFCDSKEKAWVSFYFLSLMELILKFKSVNYERGAVIVLVKV